MKIKHILSALLIVALAFGAVKPAQSQEFSKGDKVLNLGLGLGTALYSGVGYKMSIPPVSASFEVGVKDDLGIGNLGIGGYLGIAGSKYEYSSYFGNTSSWKYTYVVIGARGSYHFKDIADKFDLYAGLMPYYAIVSYSGDEVAGYNPSSSFMSISIYGGARYYFSDKFAAMAELGWGVSYLNLGVALKF